MTQASGSYLLTDASKRFASGRVSVDAVAGVSLSIQGGEAVALRGPSGSGKTTLLQLLGALDRPTGGKVEFEGLDLAALGNNELADLRRQTLGFVFQQFNLIPTLTAVENVQAALAPGGQSQAEQHDQAGQLLDEVGLGGRTDHLPSQLSGGEQQRVAIARALVNRPRVILADEPTGNLDTSSGEAVIDLLLSLVESRGVTIVVATHDSDVAGRARRVLTMRDGRVESDT